MFHALKSSPRSASVDQRNRSIRMLSFDPLTFSVTAVRLRIGPEFVVWAVNIRADTAPATVTPKIFA